MERSKKPSLIFIIKPRFDKNSILHRYSFKIVSQYFVFCNDKFVVFYLLLQSFLQILKIYEMIPITCVRLRGILKDLSIFHKNYRNSLYNLENCDKI